MYEKYFPLFIIAIISSILSYGQMSISGFVWDGQSGKPLEGVSIFINNATIGTTSLPNGSFKLTNVRQGNHEVVFSMIGFEHVIRQIFVDGEEDTLQVTLYPKPVVMKPVIILPDKQRLFYLSIFKRGFIGQLENPNDCKIINPNILYYDYDTKTKTLEVSADDFIIIENKKLGYRIKFLLNQFTYTSLPGLNNAIYFEGQAFFEEMDGNNIKRKRWIKNRKKTYTGSSMHFFRSAALRQIKEEGYIMHTLVRKKNENRPPDEIIDAQLKKFRKPAGEMNSQDRDSLDFWISRAEMPKIIQTLYRDTLRIGQILFKTDVNGIYALKFNNLLYVIHADGRDEFRSRFFDRSDPHAIPYTVMILKEDYVFFDQSGVIINPQSIVFEGHFGEQGGLAFMLPTDYRPLITDY